MADTLGGKIRDRRVETGISLRSLATTLGVSASYVSDIENDRRAPSEDVLRAFSDELDLDFDELMALAGRWGEGTQQYLRRTPAAGVLLRRLSERNVPNEHVQLLLRELERPRRGAPPRRRRTP